ncbi:tryptophan synthase putative, partial [Jimgerdemannia flammicorona]
RPVFVAFVTAGFPDPDETVDILLGLERGGADIIELAFRFMRAILHVLILFPSNSGVPFTDPLADGPTIQEANTIALGYNIDIPRCLDTVREARQRGLKVPVVFMGYYNPVLSYGEEKIVVDCKAVGVDVIILALEEVCASARHYILLSYIPLIAPSTTSKRIKHLASIADSFIYVVSKMGVTGSSDTVNSELPQLVARIREHTSLPLAVGFGVSTREHFKTVAKHANGVVIGSRIVTVLKQAGA